MLKNKKAISILCSILLSSTMLTGCGNGVIGMVSNEYNKQEQQNEYNDEYKQKEDLNNIVYSVIANLNIKTASTVDANSYNIAGVAGENASNGEISGVIVGGIWIFINREIFTSTAKVCEN